MSPTLIIQSVETRMQM